MMIIIKFDVHKPRLLSDNGASYISGELANYINLWRAVDDEGTVLDVVVQRHTPKIQTVSSN